MPVAAAERRSWWPWSLAGAGVGLVIALALLCFTTGSERAEGLFYLTMFYAAPTAWLLAPVSNHPESQVALFVLACWPVQGLLLGSFVGFSGRGGKWSRLKCWLILLALSIGVPFSLAVLFKFGT